MAGFGRRGKVLFGAAGPGGARLDTAGKVIANSKTGGISMVYQWKGAACIKADAQQAGQVCEQLEQTGGLTAKRLLDASRPEDAPLHDEFEWNDSEAAEKYREQQARHIINSLTIVVEEKPVTRAFVNIRAAGPAYESINVIVKQEDKYAALLDQCKKELQAFFKKYNSIKELAPVADAAKKLIGA